MKLWDYQQTAVDFVSLQKKVYLALAPGMGKTLTSLAAAKSLAHKNILVIAELNEIVNSRNFEKEAHLLGLNYVSLRTTTLHEVSEVTGKIVCGINPDALVKLDAKKVAELFDFVIIDEATLAKTTTTARFKAVKKICDVMEYVVLLSGTPMMNGAAELYAPLLLLGHKLAGDGTKKAREAFESIFAGGHRRKIKNTGVYWQDYTWWAKGANHVRELRYFISDRFFFMRKEESGIFKNKTRKVERVPMSMEWLAEYNAAWDEYLKDAGRRGVDMDNVAELQRLIENGQTYQVNSKWKAKQVVADIATGRYGNQRIIVFTMFVETFELLMELLEDARVSYKTFDTVHEYKAGSEQVLVGRIKAHGKGGNLPEASVVLFVDMDFVPANNVQAENRIDRPEQMQDMTVVYYMAEGDDIVDEHVRFINQDKQRKINEFMRPLEPGEIGQEEVNALVFKYYKFFKTLGYEN